VIGRPSGDETPGGGSRGSAAGGTRELPPKLFFRIGEVAGLVGVEPHVLRYWEREFRSIRPTKSAKGQRVYSRKDVENLLRVRDLLYRDGFTIAGAKKKLQRPDEPREDDTTRDRETSTATVMSLDGVDLAEAGSQDDIAVDMAIFAIARARVAAAPMLEPASGPVVRADVREKLVALRGEVEEFLAELSTNGRR
jgi:DNA-binding transcriptional MerR regulator